MYRSPEHLYDDDAAPVRPRTFQCREALWYDFQRFSQEDGISIDEEVEAAMVAYARFRGHLEVPTDPRRAPPPSVDMDRMAATQDAQSAAAELRDMPPQRRLPTPPPVDGRNLGGTARLSPARTTGPALPPVRMRSQAPPPPPVSQSGGYRPPMPPARPSNSGMPRAAPPPPQRPSMPPQHMQQQQQPLQLTVLYNGRTYPIDKDRITLGRSKQADVRLDDPNVSRQHAAIERVGERWYAVDLGSTNGIYIDGERVERRALRDGNVIEITNHRITCRIS